MNVKEDEDDKGTMNLSNISTPNFMCFSRNFLSHLLMI